MSNVQNITKQEIQKVAYCQLALDMNCAPNELLATGEDRLLLTENTPRKGWRSYGEPAALFHLVVLPGVAVISADKRLHSAVMAEYQGGYSAFAGTQRHIYRLNQLLQEYGEMLVDMHHYLLPRPGEIPGQRREEFHWYEGEGLLEFRGDPRFSNALAFQPQHPDKLAVVAKEGGEILGMAGCSADGEDLWQIGVDVLPKAQGRHLASRLVEELKWEVLRRGKVPFYGSVSTHVMSQTVAVNAGFVPAWVNLYSRPILQKKEN